MGFSPGFEWERPNSRTDQYTCLPPVCRRCCYMHSPEHSSNKRVSLIRESWLPATPSRRI